MAKTTAKKKPAAKSAKSSKSGKGLFTKLNLKSPKVQLLLVVLVFGLVGGTYMIYKSYAATVVYAWSPASISCWTGTDCRAGSLPSGKSSIASKHFGSGGTAYLPEGNYTQNVQYQVCVMAKGSATLHIESSEHNTTMYSGGSPVKVQNYTNINVNDPNTLKQYCGDTSFKPLTLRSGSTSLTMSSVGVQGSSTGQVDVTEVTVNQVGVQVPTRNPDVGPTAPAPAK